MNKKTRVICLVLAGFLAFGCTNSASDPARTLGAVSTAPSLSASPPGARPAAAVPTKLNVSVTGDDASLFKLFINTWDLTTSSALVQNSPASWDVDFADASKDILITAFIDANKNSICDEKELSCGSWFTAVRGRPTNQTILLGKSAINVAVKGNPSIFSHPKLVHNGRQTASGSLIIAPLTIGSFVTYSDLTGKYGARGNMAAFDDADNNDRYDFGEPLISSGESQEWDWAPSKKVTVSLMATAPKQIPPSGKVYISIGGDNYLPSDTQHYRFEIDSSTKRLIFFIPLGKGTDGGFIQCFQCETNPPRSAWHTGEHLWNLFNLVYAGDSAKRSRVMSNWSNQTGEWKQNIRDAVRYLEGAKGFTVYGKELLN